MYYTIHPLKVSFKYSQICASITTINFRAISLAQEATWHPWALSFQIPTPLCTFCLYRFPHAGILYKWIHTIFVYLHPTVLLCMMLSRFIHAVACAEFHSLLRLNHIPSCICYILFTHSSVDGHLGHFYFLAMVNNVATNTTAQVSVQVPSSAFLGRYPEGVYFAELCSNFMFNHLRKCYAYF